MLVIGLTGGIGTGKTQVSSVLQDLGAEVINADLIGHKVCEPFSNAWEEIVELFGKEILLPDNTIDRYKLGHIVFTNAKLLSNLNAITHPRILDIIKSLISEFCDDAKKIIVVEAALLIEANWVSLVDEVWVTIATKERVIKRITSQQRFDKETIEARMKSQISEHERLTVANVVIDNNGDIEQLTKQIKTLWTERLHKI